MTPYRKQQISQQMNQAQRRSGNKPDQWDRIRMHLVEGAALRRKADKELLEKAMVVWPLLCEGFPNRMIAEKLVEMEQAETERKARKLINDTKRIFGDVQAYNPEAEKMILIEMAKEAYKVAKVMGNGAAMAKCIKELRELQGHSEGHELADLYAQLKLPQVVYTDDPGVLQEATVENANYIEVPADEAKKKISTS